MHVFLDQITFFQSIKKRGYVHAYAKLKSYTTED